MKWGWNKSWEEKSRVENEPVFKQIIKKNKTLFQIVRNRIFTKIAIPFHLLFRGVTRLFRGIILSCFGITHLFRGIIQLLRSNILSRFGIKHFRFGIIHLLRRNILPRQSNIHLFFGIIHSSCGIRLSSYGSDFGQIWNCIWFNSFIA